MGIVCNDIIRKAQVQAAVVRDEMRHVINT